MNPYRRSLRVVGAVLAIYALLVATHLGEFWPFSIYPMFSQAGQPWTRTLVRELPDEDADAMRWQPASLEALPGEAFPLTKYGIFQNDVANYVSKTQVWDRTRIQGLRRMFGDEDVRSRRLLLLRVRGELDRGEADGDAVRVMATPFALLTPDTLRFSPTLSLSVQP